jgi:hypothetical protein
MSVIGFTPLGSVTHCTPAEIDFQLTIDLATQYATDKMIVPAQHLRVCPHGVSRPGLVRHPEVEENTDHRHSSMADPIEDRKASDRVRSALLPDLPFRWVAPMLGMALSETATAPSRVKTSGAAHPMPLRASVTNRDLPRRQFPTHFASG